LQGKGWFFVLSFFLQLAGLLTSLSMVTCDAGYECISAFSVLACFNLE
jgi:hypothetical protein